MPDILSLLREQQKQICERAICPLHPAVERALFALAIAAVEQEETWRRIYGGNYVDFSLIETLKEQKALVTSALAELERVMRKEAKHGRSD